MLGVTQPRISQLVKADVLIANKDEDGVLQIDRESVERYRLARATRHAHLSDEEKEQKRAQQAEANDRFARERKLARAREAERTRVRDELQERGIVALEGIERALRNIELRAMGPKRDY